MGRGLAFCEQLPLFMNYYLLVAACVIAHRVQWLKNACLAAALLFPAVAAIHAIILASNDVKGAVDLDVYGAFQLMAIGVLTAPITAKVSNTYFNDRGRNIIFLWSGLVLAGLLSLTVEFYRLNPVRCTDDPRYGFIPSNTTGFPYGTATCGLTCNTKDGPHSPLRGGSADNIYVIPAPTKFTFNTAMLFSAACCIPTIITLIFVWIKIVELNMKKRKGESDEQQPIDGTNGATDATMGDVNRYVQQFLDVIEIPLFVAAVLAVLIIGERNFFSKQMQYQIEPIANVGQWAPIAGTVLALLGAAYRLATGESSAEKESGRNSPTSSCTCCGRRGGDTVVEWNPDGSQDRGRKRNISTAVSEQPPSASSDLQRRTTTPSPMSDVDVIEVIDSEPRHTRLGKSETLPPVLQQQITQTTELTRASTSNTRDAGNRKKVARALTWVGNYLGTAAEDRDHEFKFGKAKEYPKTPGEDWVNPNINTTVEVFRDRREAGQEASAIARQNSRIRSYAGSIASQRDSHVAPQSPIERTGSSHRHHRSSSASPSRGGVRRARSGTQSSQQLATELQDITTPTAGPSRRRDTLEVPRDDLRLGINPRRISADEPVFVDGDLTQEPTQEPASPTIVISSEHMDFG